MITVQLVQHKVTQRGGCSAVRAMQSDTARWLQRGMIQHGDRSAVVAVQNDVARWLQRGGINVRILRHTVTIRRLYAR